MMINGINIIADPKEFILSQSDYYKDAVENGYDIRMSEEEWLKYMTLYSGQYIEFLANIEAWLSFNQSPTKEQLKELKNDILKLI